jgi:hypothetical protein
MRELVFATELRGRAAPVEGKTSTLRAQTSGRGPAGEPVNFASEVVLTGEHFHRVTAGTGEFQGATGYITSNFTVSGTGEVVDNHYVRLMLP